MAFTLGVLTDEISEDLQEAIDIAKSWGIDHIELHSAITDLRDSSADVFGVIAKHRKIA